MRERERERERESERERERDILCKRKLLVFSVLFLIIIALLP